MVHELHDSGAPGFTDRIIIAPVDLHAYSQALQLAWLTIREIHINLNCDIISHFGFLRNYVVPFAFN